MTITLTPKQAIYLYGILEGTLDRYEDVKDELLNPQDTQDAITSIMEQIAGEFDKIQLPKNETNNLN